MKTQKLLVIAATVCLLAVFVCGSAYALSPFTEIILSFWQEVTDDSAEAKNELQDAAADLADCPDEYDNCQGGIFEHDPATCKVVDAAMKKYGGYDSVFIRTAVHAPKGGIFETTAEGMFTHYEQNYLVVMYALQALLPPLMKFGQGQVVVQTSATSEKPQPTMMAYSTMRAAAAMLVRCAAMTVAPKGVCVNLVGTAKATDVQASGGKVVTSGGGKRMKLAISGQVNRAGDRQRGQQKIG